IDCRERSHRLRILITNDDGIHSEGLDVCAEIARVLSDDVWIVAPEFDQSGVAHSLTLNDPLRLRQGEERRPIASSWAYVICSRTRRPIWCCPASIAAATPART